jgi:hypothetical protein
MLEAIPRRRALPPANNLAAGHATVAATSAAESYGRCTPPLSQQQWVSAAAPEELQALGLAAPERPVVRLPDGAAPIDAKLEAIQVRCFLQRQAAAAFYPPTTAQAGRRHGLSPCRLRRPSRRPTHNPQPTRPQPTTHDPQPTTRNPQPATRNPQPTTHNPQPTTHNPQPAMQAAISSLQYNYTPANYFNVSKRRPFRRIMDTCRDILRDGLPIKCIEVRGRHQRRPSPLAHDAARPGPGTTPHLWRGRRCSAAFTRVPHMHVSWLKAAFLGMFLTAGLTELSRFPIGFKSEADGQVGEWGQHNPCGCCCCCSVTRRSAPGMRGPPPRAGAPAAGVPAHRSGGGAPAQRPLWRAGHQPPR